MKFENELYESVCNAFPSTTVRSFSKWLGMSEGYWSSIMAQQLPVSNAALGHLVDVLSVEKMKPRTAHFLAKEIDSLQKLIANEIQVRVQSMLSDFQSVALDQAVKDQQSEELFGAMPFLFSVWH